MAGKANRIIKLLLAAAIVIAALAAIGYRATQTMEYRLTYGSVKERTDLCRAVPGLGHARQMWALRRLLADDVLQVRLAGTTAYDRCPAAPEIDVILQKILTNASEPGELRTRAGQVLLHRKPVTAGIVEYLDHALPSETFRRQCAPLVGDYLRYRLLDASESQLKRMFAQAIDEQDPAHLYIQTVIKDNAEKFKPIRQQLLDMLDMKMSFSTEQFVLSVLAAIDGEMRGHAAADWKDEKLSAAGDESLQAVEAEWTTEIKPDYQIDDWHGVRCLTLGEGAGGFMSWLGAEQGTVDIGSGTTSVYAPKDGSYKVWARCWFRDKCGNSFGFVMEGMRFGNFPDKHNVLQKWHWLSLQTVGNAETIFLKRGYHRVRLEAWEDGVYLDKFAVLPVGKNPEELPDPPATRWDQGLIPSISFTLDKFSQERGTRQTAVVWVRRNDPAMKSGTVELTAGQPFVVVKPATTRVKFSEGNPIARTSFTVELPKDAVGGETLLQAAYTDDNGGEIRGQVIVGTQFDWLCTGPLKPYGKIDRKYNHTATVTDEQLKADFKPFPIKGYDRYRRLNFEDAYGQLQNVYLYLCTTVEVKEEGNYLALLTVDDTANVYLGGNLIVSQPHGGPGEGRLVMKPVYLKAGKQRLFVRVWQANFPDPPSVENRASFNHCVLKLLLRKSRHVQAANIVGLPWPEELKAPEESAADQTAQVSR